MRTRCDRPRRRVRHRLVVHRDRDAYDAGILGMPEVALDPGMLPEVLAPDGVAGTVTAAAAAFLGIPAGIPVGPGSGDNAGAALGLGLTPGIPVVSLGTSGVAFAVSVTRPVDPSGMVAGFADASGHFLPLTATLNCTLAVDRVAAWLGLDREAVAPSDGVVVLPWLDGERTPDLPDAQAAFLGLRHDTVPGAILGATYEGAVEGLLEATRRHRRVLRPAARGRAHRAHRRGRARERRGERPCGGCPGGRCWSPRTPTWSRGARRAQAAAALAGTDPIRVQSGWARPTRRSSTRCPSTRPCSTATGASAQASSTRWAPCAPSRPDGPGVARLARLDHGSSVIDAPLALARTRSRRPSAPTTNENPCGVRRISLTVGTGPAENGASTVTKRTDRPRPRSTTGAGA